MRMTEALFTHHHYGWRRHDIPDSTEDSLRKALIKTHSFLLDPHTAGNYRVEIERTPQYSFDGIVKVFWSGERHHPINGLSPGEYWFRAFEFNVADESACRHCGGTGRDHYVPVFSHCWACDGTGTQIRQHTWRGFKRKPTPDALESLRKAYAEYLETEASKP